MLTTTTMINIKEDYGHKRPSETMMDFNSAVKILELPNEIAKGSWHYTIKADSLLHFYVDIDKDLGRTLPSLLDNIRDYFLSIIPDFSEEDIKLSQNESKPFSFHIDIPRVCGTPAEIHSHIKAIAIAGDWPEKQWDILVYPTEQNKTRLYRMPHQAKPGANGTPYNDDAKHSIINGKTLDFILDYYPDSAHRLEMIQHVVYNSNKLASPKKNNETIHSNDLSKIIDCLSVARATDYETWRNVGFSLKNIETKEDENMSHFITFSKKYPLHDDDAILASKYCRFKPEDKSNLDTLIAWAKKDNSELYNTYFPVKLLIQDYSEEEECHDDDDATETCEMIPEKVLEEANKKLKEGEKIVFNDNHAGKSAYKRFRSSFKFCKGQLFVKTGNIWSMNVDIVESKMRINLSDLGLKAVDRKGNLSNYCGNYTRCEAVRKCTMDIIYSRPDDAFYNLLHSTTKGKMCFKNGVYDFHSKRFDLWTSDWIKEHPVYSCIQVDRDYNANVDAKTKEEVRKTIIDDVFGDQANNYLHFLGRAMAGEIQDKVWGLFLGNRDCGKGVNVGMARNALGDYVGEFESDRLMCEQFAEIDSKKNGWLIPYQFKRIMFSNELQRDDKGKRFKLNSKLIKSINSGGDEMEARALYSNTVQLKLQCAMMIMANDAPPATTNDVFEKCLELKTTRQFKSQQHIDDEIASAESELEKETYQNQYRIADPNIKDKTKSSKWADAFIQIVIENYKEKAIYVSNKCEDDGEQPISNMIFKLLNVTGNYNDFISVADVKTVFKDCNVSMKVIKSNLLSIKGITEGRNNSGTMRGFKGIKSKNSICLIDELDK